jgi:hypothetical protein
MFCWLSDLYKPLLQNKTSSSILVTSQMPLQVMNRLLTIECNEQDGVWKRWLYPSLIALFTSPKNNQEKDSDIKTQAYYTVYRGGLCTQG